MVPDMVTTIFSNGENSFDEGAFYTLYDGIAVCYS